MRRVRVRIRLRFRNRVRRFRVRLALRQVWRSGLGFKARNTSANARAGVGRECQGFMKRLLNKTVGGYHSGAIDDKDFEKRSVMYQHCVSTSPNFAPANYVESKGFEGTRRTSMTLSDPLGGNEIYAASDCGPNGKPGGAGHEPPTSSEDQ
eukprot:1358365-Amorphochlora_amoeboformis.AAC.1